MKFYGQFDPPVDRFIFERYFPDKGISGVFVECGAFDGVMESSCKFFEETLGWRGFNFEPVPVLYERLVVNRPLAVNIDCALSDKDGFSQFRHAIHPELDGHFGNGSIDHHPDHIAHLQLRGCTFDEFNVRTTTWKKFIEDYGVDHVDLMVLDVEGHELSVLDGMKDCSVLPDVMCVEFGHTGLDKLRGRMRSLGYAYDVSSNGNAFFVRKDCLGLFAFRRISSCAPYPRKENEFTDHRKKVSLFFVHIPKCAGTAFENYVLSLGQGFDRSRAFTGIGVNGEPETLDHYFKEESGSPFLFGHIPYAAAKNFSKECFFAVFLRDPVLRTLSQYRSWHDPDNFRPGDHHHDSASPEVMEALRFAQSASLEEFVRSSNRIVVDNALGNLQVKFLSTYSGSSMEAHLESAMRNLENFDFVGIADRFAESIAHFRVLVPEAGPYRVAKEGENRSRIKSEEVSDDLMALIREQVKYDLKLYAYGKSLFDRRLNEMRCASGKRLLGLYPSEEVMDVERSDASGLASHDEEIAARNAELTEEAKRVREQLAQLEASYRQLSDVYHEMVGSRSWRLVTAIQSLLPPYGKK